MVDFNWTHKNLMRLIHTSDWHLGQRFYHHSREVEHAQFLDWLHQQLAIHQPDALLIAGDIFDTVNPPISAQRQLYEFLACCYRDYPALQIIMIAGNHDSGSRIELPAPLLGAMNVQVVGRVQWHDDQPDFSQLIVPIQRMDDAGNHQVLGWCVALPYLRAAEVTANGLSPDVNAAITTLHAQVLAQVAVQKQPDQAVVLMSHAHLSGGEMSDSVRNVVIGTLEAQSVSLYPEWVDYVALGHLHKPQKIAGQERVRYSGSPIPLSFSERHYPHQVLLVEIESDQPLQVTPLLIPRAVPMLQFKDTLPNLIEQLQQYAWPAADVPFAQQAWLEICVQLQGEPPPVNLRQILDQHLPEHRARLLRLRCEQHPDFKVDATVIGADPFNLHELPEPKQLFEQLWQQQYGQPSEQVLADFEWLLQALQDQSESGKSVLDSVATGQGLT
ncbi:MAG: exonuclease subunit SbcD [Pseudomonadota bacterium]|nr:exonuclease subunit SbcD [Pseudomonadota bacterium]